MHIIDKIECPKTHLLRPCMPFTDEELDQGERMEIWGTDFDEGEADFCEYRLFKGEVIIASKRQEGY